jgi:hypothetical protein
VQWFNQGRRRITPDPNNFSDVLDEPRLQILSSRLVKTQEGRLSVVGELMNIDVDPTDVTVSAYLYDTAGEELTWYNANEGIMHKLLPQEITPFRVDFEGVAGMALEEVVDILDFNPTRLWSYSPPAGAKLGDYSVFAKSVITPHDLYRDVGTQHLTVEPVDGNLVLRGQLINNGTLEATIPHILVTLYDDNGQVVWVDHHYLREGVRPQRTVDFNLSLTPIESLQLLNNPGYLYPGLDESEHISPRSDFVELPPGYGYRYLRVSVNYFAGGAE